jgi:uncharacterized protein (DUF486 family)
MRTIVLLLISNVFMTFAWYGHLKYRSAALWKVIIASWGIAFFEYCFQVPANRIGSYEFNGAQLKTIQEGNHADRVFGFLDYLPWRKVSVELRRRVCVHRTWGFLCISQIVRQRAYGFR